MLRVDFRSPWVSTLKAHEGSNGDVIAAGAGGVPESTQQDADLEATGCHRLHARTTEQRLGPVTLVTQSPVCVCDRTTTALDG